MTAFTDLLTEHVIRNSTVLKAAFTLLPGSVGGASMRRVWEDEKKNKKRKKSSGRARGKITEREREGVCVCERERERERKRVCVREGESKREREGGRDWETLKSL